MSIIGKFVLFIFTKIYKIIRPYKQAIKEIISPHHNVLRSLFTNKYVVHALVVLVTILITFQNIFAYENVRSEHFGKNTLLYSMLGTDDFDEIIEESVAHHDQYMPIRYMQDNAVSSFLVPHDQHDAHGTFSPLQTPTAVVKPDIIDTKSSEKRDAIITYTVQAGDTLSTIAQKFTISTNTLIWENELSYYSTIRPGDSLRILPVSGISHKIKSGETLQGIAKKYEADVEKIVEFNKLTNASDIYANQALIIPEGKKVVAFTPSAPKPATTTTVARAPASPPVETLASSTQVSAGMIWPTSSRRVTQYYHWRHQAVDIGGAGQNHPLYAVEKGKVTFIGWRNGYGNTVEVELDNGYFVRYAHLHKIYVEKGQSVSKGDVVGLMGTTGWSTGIHLHFEIMKNGVKLNPLNLLD